MMKKSNRILILGVGGFIGTNVFNFFINNKNYSVLGVSRIPKTDNSKTRLAFIKKVHNHNVYTYKSLNELIAKIKEFKPNTIINCVGLIFEKKYIGKYLFTNVIFPKKIITEASKFKLKKFIHLSTIDTSISPNIMNRHLNYYAYSKKMGDENIRKICTDNSISYTLLKSATVYGNYMNDDRLISQILKNIKTGKKLNIHNNSKKNFVNVENICLLLNKEIKINSSKTLYLCSKRSFLIIDFLKFVEKVLNKKINYRINNLTDKIVENIEFKSYEERYYGTKLRIVSFKDWEKINISSSITNLYKCNQFSVSQIQSI